MRATGVTKANGIVEQAFFEHFVRDSLNKKSKRVMAVLDPLKVITNFDGEEDVVLKDYPQNEESTYRNYKFTKELYIERSDFVRTTKIQKTFSKRRSKAYGGIYHQGDWI